MNQILKEQKYIIKLKKCSVVFNFTKNTMITEKTNKRHLLEDLIDFCSQNKSSLVGIDFISASLTMIHSNIFRTLPKCEYFNGIDVELPETVNDPAWFHLELVYEYFLNFLDLSLPETALKAKPFKSLARSVILMLDSKDSRERSYLEFILHKIFSKIISLRTSLLKCMSNVILWFLYDGETFNGVQELLTVFQCIIEGMNVPLKRRNVELLKNIILPLHKSRCLCVFHSRLSLCDCEFVRKDPGLFGVVLEYLIRIYPRRCSRRGVLIIDEISRLFQIVDVSLVGHDLCCKFVKFMAPFYGDLCYQIAEKVLTFPRQEWMLNLILRCPDLFLDALIPVLYESAHNHWSLTICLMNFDAMNFLHGFFPEIFMKNLQKL